MTSELLITKPEVYIYPIPLGNDDPRCVDHRSLCWTTEEAIWKGQMSICMDGSVCYVQLKNQDGIYGQTDIEEFPGENLKPVKDSRRFFILSLQLEGMTNNKLVGFGFENCDDGREIISLLTGYFKSSQIWMRKHERGLLKETFLPQPTKSKSLEPQELPKETETFDPQYKYLKKKSNNEYYFRCYQCSDTFDLAKEILIHWKEKHQFEEASTCSHCSLPFVSHGELRYHLQKFHKISSILRVDMFNRRTVPNFNVGKTRSDATSTYLKKIPKLMELSIGNLDKNIFFQCRECPDKFEISKELVNHWKNIHGFEEACLCPSCKRPFIYPVERRLHLRKSLECSAILGLDTFSKWREDKINKQRPFQ